ncbi:MAG: hypothetical protein M1826_007065 [Phylliscum demangeonii]|nr:MAG: hypothetical protein M1826_007065 [Phylliscum demangeonii]
MLLTSINAEDLSYQLRHITDDVRPMIIAVNSVLGILATAAVIARIYSRRIMKAPLQRDDWTIVAALVFAYGGLICCFIGTREGMGRHTLKIGLAKTTIALKVMYIYQIFFAFANGTIKISILMMYQRIFTTAPFTRACYILGTFNVCCFISFVTVVVFQCRPIYNAWQEPLDPRCIDRVAFFLSAGTLSVLVDCGTLMAPMFMVWRLQASMRRKLALTFMFCLGGFVCVAGIVRLPYVARISFGADPSWRSTPALFWSNIEICIGIVCGCLPTLRPVVRVSSDSLYSLKGRVSAWSLRTGRYGRGTGRGSGSGSDGGSGSGSGDGSDRGKPGHRRDLDGDSGDRSIAWPAKAAAVSMTTTQTASDHCDEEPWGREGEDGERERHAVRVSMAPTDEEKGGIPPRTRPTTASTTHLRDRRPSWELDSIRALSALDWPYEDVIV